ncbi:putative zinc finger protein CONSTANS-LIKE 11 [Acorus calamus]|uniref:Zinc finger protein CONSTANS-LIKE 11 n=1 Tax=Acorus calamus TaxID=4465 RepID=A0AAV9DNJ4_ACOCL|nr:putative zinc finger protein CONSTANS-LIKE 11 [Acorus calamus]
MNCAEKSAANNGCDSDHRPSITGPSHRTVRIFVDFHMAEQGVDLGASLGLRRVHTENNIQTLGIGNANFIQPSFDHHRLLGIGSYAIEERKQKLSRYRKKRSKRYFGRKIKYVCRKALANSQPRVRGRFAKTEESEVPKLLM